VGVAGRLEHLQFGLLSAQHLPRTGLQFRKLRVGKILSSQILLCGEFRWSRGRGKEDRNVDEQACHSNLRKG
jgi:hypothetical protein